MDNMHEPPSGDPQDFWPTQEMGPSAAQPGPPATPSRPRRHGRALWWGGGLALVALLAGGGAAVAELSSSVSPAPSGLTGQAAQLNTMLNSPSSVSASALGTVSTTSTATPCLNRAEKLKAAGHPFAAREVLRLCRHPLERLRLLGGMHGEFTFDTKTGPRTIAFERGVIESVSGSNVVVAAKDGTTWTWILESNTVIRQNGQKSSTSGLSNGEHVFAAGPVVSGGYDARLIAVAPSSGSQPPSPSSSPATGS
jgi:hypothetical protein